MSGALRPSACELQDASWSGSLVLARQLQQNPAFQTGKPVYPRCLYSRSLLRRTDRDNREAFLVLRFTFHTCAWFFLVPGTGLTLEGRKDAAAPVLDPVFSLEDTLAAFWLSTSRAPHQAPTP